MVEQQLQEWRSILNIIDESIMKLLSKRYDVCRSIGTFKKNHNIPMMQPERVQEVIQRCVTLGANSGIPEELTEKLYRLIIEQACNMETEVIEA